jgi:uncharacterized protein
MSVPASQSPAADLLPREHLPARALTSWRVASLLVGVPVVVAGLVAAVAIPGLPSWARSLIAAVPILLVAADLAAQPIRFRLWRYAIDEEEITLQHGWPVTTLTVVPMVRVQHVSVERGPLARHFRLSDLSIHTAAGTIRIPAVDHDRAEEIRRQIATLARIVDDL